MTLSPAAQENFDRWMSPDFDAETRSVAERMLQENPQEAEDAFYKALEFGTGGLRGIMGVGSNRINDYTIAMATQGLADYLGQSFDTDLSVAIAYDSRNKSPELAKCAAEVLAANGIKVYLYETLRPTPLLSYTVRALGCQAGIVITASHNPKEYNGYKVYWNDGGQLVPPHDSGVIGCVRKIKGPADVKQEGQSDLIVPVPAEVEAGYYASVKGLLKLPQDHVGKKNLKIVFTSLHGTGITMVPEALEQAGFSQVHVLASQAEADGNFPTVNSPNPEEQSAMLLALEEADRIGADIILGTDPDADRVGMGIRDEAGKLQLLNGNQAAALMLHYLLENASPEEKQKGFAAKTIVTTELLRDICAAHQVPCYETLTGFKYIAELIGNLEGKKQFIGGGEESYGYLVGDFVRDKDAVISSVMLCEMAAWALGRNMSTHELLQEVYAKYGLYREHLVSLVKKGKQGAEEIVAIMERYRSESPKEIAGIGIDKIADYKTQETLDCSSGKREAISFPKSNVIQFFLTDGSKVTARPSGTEPKIKYYISVKASSAGLPFEDAWAEAGDKINQFCTSLGI